MSLISSTATLPDQQPVIIAGLMKDSVTGNASVIPISIVGSTAGGFGLGMTPVPWLYKNVLATATTTISSVPGILHGVSINLASSETALLLDATVTIGTITADALGTVIYDVAFNTNLLLVASGTGDLTVLYK